MTENTFKQLRSTGTTRVVGISEMFVSREPADVVVTYSLGSCIGLTLHDPVAGVGGLVHCMLPLSRMDPARAASKPETFVDTGVGAMLQTLFDMGATRRHLVAKVAGGAEMHGNPEVFRIGPRNFTVVRKVLWKNDILIGGEDVGGVTTRTMYLYMATGQTTVRADGREVEL